MTDSQSWVTLALHKRAETFSDVRREKTVSEGGGGGTASVKVIPSLLRNDETETGTSTGTSVWPAWLSIHGCLSPSQGVLTGPKDTGLNWASVTNRKAKVAQLDLRSGHEGHGEGRDTSRRGGQNPSSGEGVPKPAKEFQNVHCKMIGTFFLICQIGQGLGLTSTPLLFILQNGRKKSRKILQWSSLKKRLLRPRAVFPLHSKRMAFSCLRF